MKDERNRQVSTDDRYEPDATKEDLRDRGAADQLRGKLNRAGGKVQQGVGKVSGKKDLQRKGRMRETKGNVQEIAGKAERKLDDALDR